MRQVLERAGQCIYNLLVHQARDVGGREGAVRSDNAVKLPIPALLKECSPVGSFGCYKLSKFTEGAPCGMRTVPRSQYHFDESTSDERTGQLFPAGGSWAALKPCRRKILVQLYMINSQLMKSP